MHAPGRTEPAAALTAVHHLNLAHGLAVAAVKRVAPDAKLAVTLNLAWVRPLSDSPGDLDAARRVDGLQNRVWLGPMLHGEYPQDVLEDTKSVTDWSFVRDGDLGLIHQPIEMVGVNYYSPTFVRQWDGTSPREEADGHGDAAGTPWVACTDVEFPEQPGPKTAMNWGIDPRGMTELLLRVHEERPDLELAVTENGAAYDDVVDENGEIHDHDRVDYLRRHIGAVLDAIEAGVPVTGYMVWSLLDNFEWSYGYSKRFGIVRVDFDSQQRTPKLSARFYTDVLTRNALDA